MVVTGVLGLQGDFQAHERSLDEIGVTAAIVKKTEQLDDVDGLIIPGGESTTLIKLMDTFEFWDPIQRFVESGRPVFGTCAGLIVLATEVVNPSQKSLAGLDVTVERNSYGRQRESFEATGFLSDSDYRQNIPMIFIRAPKILRVGKDVGIVASWGKETVMVRAGNVLGATFHPELSEGNRVHRYFVDMIST